MALALGYLDNGDVVGFVLATSGGSKRGITYFFQTDDFDQTKEKISMIRGGGPRGRSGFAPHEPVPEAYRGFKTGVLKTRRAGKWNVRASLPRRMTMRRCSATPASAKLAASPKRTDRAWGGAFAPPHRTILRYLGITHGMPCGVKTRQERSDGVEPDAGFEPCGARRLASGLLELSSIGRAGPPNNETRARKLGLTIFSLQIMSVRTANVRSPDG